MDQPSLLDLFENVASSEFQPETRDPELPEPNPFRKQFGVCTGKHVTGDDDGRGEKSFAPTDPQRETRIFWCWICHFTGCWDCFCKHRC